MPFDPVLPVVDDVSIPEHRARAAQHKQLQYENFQKAQVAYRSGQGAVASFYAQQGHLHADRLREANRHAAHAILKRFLIISIIVQFSPLVVKCF